MIAPQKANIESSPSGIVRPQAQPLMTGARGGGAHHRHPRATGETGPNTSPVEGAVVGGQDDGPLARVPEEETPPARAARRGGHPVAPAKELVFAAEGSEVGFDVGESAGGVRNELAEVLHDHPLVRTGCLLSGRSVKPLWKRP